MNGAAMQLRLEKTSGLVRFQTGATRVSPGFESNDLGFRQRADEIEQNNWVGLQFTKPKSWYRTAFLNVNQWNGWNHDGLSTFRGGNVNGSLQLPNQMSVNAGVGLIDPGTTYGDRAARGGPAVRKDGGAEAWWGWSGDRRKSIIPNYSGGAWQRDEGRSHGWYSGIGASYRWTTRLQGSLSLNYDENTNDWQWFGNVREGDVTHYTFAHLDQRTMSTTARLDLTATPTLSIQLYAQPFISSGDYSNLRELADARAGNYEDRFTPFDGSTLEDFNFKQFRSNTVVRWQYRPGSALFFVWQQGRDQSSLNPGSFSASRDYRDLFNTRSDNTFLIKASYWFNP
jgi:hypothetical protein